MRELYDIKCMWNGCGEYLFNDTNALEGKLLKDSDGWFEGIIGSKNSASKEDVLIFGFLYPDKVIKMYKISPNGACEPMIFNGIDEGNGYEGPSSIISFASQEPIGVSRIITSRQEIKDEEEIKRRIDECLRKTKSKHLYDSQYSMRKQISKKILISYESYMENQKKLKK